MRQWVPDLNSADAEGFSRQQKGYPQYRQQQFDSRLQYPFWLLVVNQVRDVSISAGGSGLICNAMLYDIRWRIGNQCSCLYYFMALTEHISLTGVFCDTR